MSLSKLIEDKLKELEEMSTTGAGEAYDSKYAFSKDEEDENKNAEQAGYKKVKESKFKKLAKSTFLSEASYKEYKKDQSLSSKQKVNKSIKEITKNDGKTFAQMRAEVDEACWDSHKQVGTKMKGGKQVPNCVPKNESKEADKGKKEQEAGEDTRDPKQKTMSGKVATSPEMNPKVDYKY